MIILIILLTISILLNIILLIAGIRKVNTIDLLASENEQLILKDEYNKEKAESLLNSMREIDIRGSFESDDEVGSVFTELKELIEQYNSEI